MKPLIPLTLSFALLAGCQTTVEKNQDWKIACIEETVRAHSTDIHKFAGLLSSGSLVVSPTLPLLPACPKESAITKETIGKGLETASKVAPLIPAPFGMAIAGILAFLSGLFKNKE